MLSNHTSAIKTSAEEIDEGAHKDDIAIVPLAMPLLAGPGAIATVMVLSAQSKRLMGAYHSDRGEALIATALISYLDFARCHSHESRARQGRSRYFESP